MEIKGNLEVLKNLDVNGHRAAGSIASIQTDSVDYIAETFTGYDLANYNSVGQFVATKLSPSADLTDNIFQTGGYYTAQWNSARDGMIATSPNGKYASIRGFTGTAGTAGTATGNLERALGVYMITQHLGSGIINNAYGVWGWIDNNNTTNETGSINIATNFYSQCTTGKATGIIGTRYGMRIIDATGVGGLTNQYGLYIDSLAKGSSVNYGIYCVSDSYFGNNVSALSFTDRTPYYDGDALTELSKIKGIDGKLDHKTLPQFAQKKVKERVEISRDKIEARDAFEDIEIGGKMQKKLKEDIIEDNGFYKIEYETQEKDGRDLGAMVSILTKAVQQLTGKVKVLENK